MDYSDEDRPADAGRVTLMYRVGRGCFNDPNDTPATPAMNPPKRPASQEVSPPPEKATMKRRYLCILCAVAALSPAAVPASQPTSDSMRCGSYLVYVGDPKHEVLRRCGEPDSAALVGERLHRFALPYGPLHYSTESLVPVEEWIYERGYGRFIRILTFEGSTLTRIELGPRM